MSQRASNAATLTNKPPHAAQPLHHLSGTLAPRAPFDFAQTLAFLRMFTPTADEQCLADGALTKAIALNGRAVVFRVRDEGSEGSGEGSVERPQLAYTLTSATPISATEHAALRERLSRFLSLDDDLRPFYACAEADPVLAPVVAARYGLHQPTFLTPFEIACWAVLTQRAPIAIARRVKDRLTARYGAALTVEGAVYRAFPEVATLAAAAPDDLAALVGNSRKVEYLQAVIAFFSQADETFLRTGPLDEVIAQLRGVRGLGAWSVAFILVRGLGRIDYALPTDEALTRAAARLYNGGQPLAPAEMRRLLDRYGETRGYWAFYCRLAVNNGDHHDDGL